MSMISLPPARVSSKQSNNIFLESNLPEKRSQALKLSGALYGVADKDGVNLTKYGRKSVVHIPSRQKSKRVDGYQQTY